MALNAYAVLDVFLTGLRLPLALGVVLLGAAALGGCRGEARTGAALERAPRFYLLFLLALVLVVLNAVSWPVLYLLLDSLVAEHPAAMCIYGVRQIGAGSAGLAGWLPGLVETLEIGKPILVFLTGVWLVLHGLNRRTRTGPLTRRVVVALVVLGVVGATEASAELTYLAIPKQEPREPGGCCTLAGVAEAAGASALPPNPASRARLAGGYYGVNAGMLLGIAALAFLPRRVVSPASLAVISLGAAVSLVVSSLFLKDVAAPLLLGLPYHRCVYDLIAQAPETTLGIAAFVLATCAVGWACTAAIAGRCPETSPFLPAQLRAVLRIAFFGYLGSLAMMSVECAMAGPW